MGGTSAGRVRLLFVLSGDYGELSNALYLIAGGAFDATLLLPERLFAANRDSLPAPTRAYTDAADVIRAVREERPDVVFLFSGYLYGVNNLIGAEDLETLLRGLTGQGCRVVTSDPFLGVLSRCGPSPFSDRHPRRRWLTEHFARLAALFEDVTHLYLIDPGPGAGGRAVSFFNEGLIADPARLPEELARRVGVNPARRRWLFVLSLEDYACQVNLWGQDRFDELLLGKLAAAARAGRQPLLVAPEVCSASLGERAARVEGLILLPFCGHGLFASLALEAEHAFYWNVFSNSVLPRVVNRLPVFFFDSGHMARAIPPLYEVGIRLYYGGQAPPYLGPEALPEAEPLAGLARAQAEALAAALARFRQSPSPQALVERLLRRG